jgi:hypothetical protein
MADPYKIKFSHPKNTIVSAYRIHSLKQPDQSEVVAGNFRDEFFLICHGVSSLPHAPEAARLTRQTAIWGYELIRQRNFYWAAKSHLLYRIFKSTNITLWQKSRDFGFEEGLASMMSLVVTVANNIWIGSLGDIRIDVYSAGKRLAVKEGGKNLPGKAINMLGIKRYGTDPDRQYLPFENGSLAVIMTKRLAELIDTYRTNDVATLSLDGTASVETIADILIGFASQEKITSDEAVYVIRREAYSLPDNR